MNRGDTLVFDLQVLQPIPGSDARVPANITGWSAWFTVKRFVQDPDSFAIAQITLTTSTPAGGTIVFTVPVNGQLEITMPPIATRDLPDGGVSELAYDVQVKDLIGRVFTVDRGILFVDPDVTRAIT